MSAPAEPFPEIAPALTPDQALAAASRCLYCYDAPCVRACPTEIDIPAFIKKISTDNVAGSARVIMGANVLGASCARVCPVEVLCEGACVEKAFVKAPVEIARLQRYATDYAFARNVKLFERGAPTGRSVAIIGSGPAGLGAAAELAKQGHVVTLFDERELPGGLDTYGMAEYKMNKDVALREVAILVEQLGVTVKQRTRVGRDASASEPGGRSAAASPTRGGGVVTHISIVELEQSFDAIFVGVGLGATQRLGIPGEDLPNVREALSFIEELKLGAAPSLAGKVAITLGAGNTAIDCVTQAKLLGASESFIVYRRGPDDMPAFPYEYELAKSMDCGFRFHTQPVRIERRGERLALICERTEMFYGALRHVADSQHELLCDVVIEALGQEKRKSFLATLPIELEASGRVKVNPKTGQTSNPKYFAGGDCVNGGSEAVNAVAEGKLAGKGLGAWLATQPARSSAA